MFFISHACKPSCARKIDDVKPTVQSSCVCTRRMYDARVHVRNAQAKFGLRMLLKYRVHRPNGLLRTAAILQATLRATLQQ